MWKFLTGHSLKRTGPQWGKTETEGTSLRLTKWQCVSVLAATGSTTMQARSEPIVWGSTCGSHGLESWSGWDNENHARQYTL